MAGTLAGTGLEGAAQSPAIGDVGLSSPFCPEEADAQVSHLARPGHAPERGGGGTGSPYSACPRAQLPALCPKPVPPFPDPGLAGPSVSPGSSGHIRWEMGGQVTTWPGAQVCLPLGAEPPTKGFRVHLPTYLSVERAVLGQAPSLLCKGPS